MGTGTVQNGAVPVQSELFILCKKLCQQDGVPLFHVKGSPALHAFHVQHIFAMIGGNVLVERFLRPTFRIPPDLVICF